MILDGQKVYLQREKLNISRTDLSKIVGVSYVRIWQIERDRHTKVHTLLANALAKALKCRPNQLEVAV